MKITRRITVLPLGPGDPGLLTLRTAEALRDPSARIILRTERHPVASWLRDQGISFSSLDDYYDRYEDFDQMHRDMAEDLWKEAASGKLDLGVMDPLSDGLVAALRSSRPEAAQLILQPGVQPEAACLSALPDGVPPLNEGLQTCPASGFSSFPWDPSASLLILELDSLLLAGDVKLRLAEVYPEEADIIFFPPSEDSLSVPKIVPLYLLDAQKKYDHTAAVFLPGLNTLQRTRYTFRDLEQIMSRLRAPDGCPWDRIQTHESLRPYLVEEAWEAVNAIDEGNMDHLADELGDVLFQVFFHASIGRSFDEFTMTDVLSGICHKMIQRHPHVFVSSHGESARDISDGWERQKRAETGSRTVGESLNDVSAFLPALKYSIKVYKKLAQLPALRRNPVRIAEEIRSLSASLLSGDQLSPQVMSLLLMKCTELCYRTDQDAEILLHQGVEHMKRRVQKLEKELEAQGRTLESLSPEEWTSLTDGQP